MNRRDVNVTAATVSTAAPSTLTLAGLECVARRLRDLPPEPIGEWMRAQGAPPEEWTLVLPDSMRAESPAPLLWPRYVQFSPMLNAPVLLRRDRR